MDINFLLEIILKALGSALATVLITYATILFNNLKAKIGDVRLNTFITKCVEAAEQLFPNLGTKTGAEKYEYVKQLVLDKFPKLEDNAHLKALIEGAVYKVSQEVKQVAKEQEINNIQNTLSSF